MKRLLLTLAMLLPAVHAQEVLQTPVTPDDLLRLLDNSVAVEIPIPDGATGFRLAYGPVPSPFGLSTFIREPAETLRVVVLLPDPSAVNPCPAGQAEATIIALPVHAEHAGSHHRQKACTPHPEKHLLTGALNAVIEGQAPALNEWRPLLVHAWLINIGQDDTGSITSAMDTGNLFSVQLYFSDSNSTAFPDEPQLGAGELLALPAVQELVDRYGISRSTR